MPSSKDSASAVNAIHLRPEVARIVSPALAPMSVARPDEEMLTVSPATKRVAFAYERFRNTLEPDEEDILRRNAIYRVLERRLAEDRPPQVIAEALLQELMRANYCKSVTKKFATEVAHVLYRAQVVRQGLPDEVNEWILRITAVSIDRKLFPHQLEESLVSLMYHDTFKRTEWVDSLVAPADRPTQLYIGCHRVLFEADDYEIAYHYFVHHFPAWYTPEFTDAEAATIKKELPVFYRQVQGYIYHDARERVSRLLRPTAVPYRILRDLVAKPGAFASGEQFLLDVQAAVEARAGRARVRMNRRAWHSILFLFLTKTIIAGLLEIPYEVFLLRQFHSLALVINVTFHPVLLFFLATTARMPGQRNTDKIIEALQKIVTGENSLPVVIMRRTRRYGAITWTLFALVYISLFLLMFWGLFSLLNLLHFSLVAMFMFVMFLGLVSFLAIRIRRSIDEIRVLPAREGAIGTLVAFLSLPVLEFGRWLAKNISQINIALFLMDRVLEAPFKVLIDVTEEWFTFVRDRREEIV